MLLDTSGLFCYLDARDGFHLAAVAHFDNARLRLTHSYVLAELVALCQARGLGRALALDFVAELTVNPLVDVVWVDQALHARALILLQARPDKSYSLCDAVSFVLMRDRDIANALSTDHHFEQEGFARLLKR